MADFLPECPFPLRTSEGTVTDELCVCGHLRSQHAHTFAWGHGACVATGVMACPCEKFSWSRHVLAGQEPVRVGVEDDVGAELDEIETLMEAPLSPDEWNMLAAMDPKERTLLRQFLARARSRLVHS